MATHDSNCELWHIQSTNTNIRRCTCGLSDLVEASQERDALKQQVERLREACEEARDLLDDRLEQGTDDVTGVSVFVALDAALAATVPEGEG